MQIGATVVAALTPIMHELALFAAIWFLVGAIDELLVDLIWLLCMESRRVASRGAWSLKFDDLPASGDHRFAVFIPAWKEADVIGPMLRAAERAYAGDNVHVFVGCYPNDSETRKAISAEERDGLSLVIVDRDGPTTKAHCLNNLYEALQRHEERTGLAFAGAVLHDAEDVISPDEARVFSAFVDRYAMVQLPVVPLIDRCSRWIGGHYCDEFAESHSRAQVAREALGAGLPGAGVGCVFRRDALKALEEKGGGKPFAEDSITEDYECGLKLRDMGFRAAFVRVGEAGDPGFVCTRSHFPETFIAAVKQKSRWVIGISLAGWDRLGWGRGLAENWMRLRDRRALIVSAVLLTAYVDLAIGLTIFATGEVAGVPFPKLDPALLALVEFNGAVLVWRLALRGYFTGRIYGWREGLRAVPRALVSNAVGITATIWGLYRYAQMLAKRQVEWDKTSHKFAEGAQP